MCALAVECVLSASPWDRSVVPRRSLLVVSGVWALQARSVNFHLLFCSVGRYLEHGGAAVCSAVWLPAL